MTYLRARLPFALFALCSLAAGCMSFESIEQRQVRTDRYRMRHGQPLKYHKDSIELSEHALALRLGKNGAKPLGPPPDMIEAFEQAGATSASSANPPPTNGPVVYKFDRLDRPPTK